MRLAKQDTDVLRIIKEQIRAGILGGDDGIGDIEALPQRIALIDTEIDAKISSVTADNIEDYDDKAIMELLTEKNELEHRLQKAIEQNAAREGKEEKVQEVLQITDMLKNNPMKFDDKMLHKQLKRVEVLSTEEILITFAGGLQMREKMQDSLKRMPIRKG